jgi:DNA-binding CsgD family transcriptional regulator
MKIPNERVGFESVEQGAGAPAPKGAAASGPILEKILNLLDQAIILAEIGDGGTPRLRFLNRAAKRVLSGTIGAEPGAEGNWPEPTLVPSIEGAIKHSLEQMGTGAGPSLDRWLLSGRSITARVTRLSAQGSDLLAIEVEAEATQPTEGTAALAEAFHLNMQEARLLRLVWRGLANEEIGTTLGIPAGTVKSRLYRLFRRLGVRTRAQAAVLAADLLARTGQGVGAPPRPDVPAGNAGA